MKRGQRGFGSALGGAGFGFGSASGSSLSYLAEPPSFTAISDPNVVVSLKNVLKKDSTTKAKGLEELIHHAQSHPFEEDGGVEEALLDIWVCYHSRFSSPFEATDVFQQSIMPNNHRIDPDICSNLH
jgi:hypothetical protein